MKNEKVYWKDVIKMLKTGIDNKNFDVDFNNEKVEFKEASLLNRNGIRVPENLIYYDEEKEIKEWLKKENIDVTKLATQLINNFYATIKKNVAL